MKILQFLVLIFLFAVIGNAQKAVLTGAVYDAYGAVIPGTKVKAMDNKGEKFSTVTDAGGIYILNLPFNLYEPKNASDFRISLYDIIVESEHFEISILKNFKFVPSYKGVMNLDIAIRRQA